MTQAVTKKILSTLSMCLGAWHFYPVGLQTLQPAVASWWAAKDSRRQPEVWESRDASLQFQVSQGGFASWRSHTQLIQSQKTTTPFLGCCGHGGANSPLNATQQPKSYVHLQKAEGRGWQTVLLLSNAVSPYCQGFCV